jgi:DNA-binding ferritin-like protein
MSCELIAHACLDASLRFHFMHVHVESPQFIGLHAFYGDAYEALEGWYDRFAERARAEGETARAFSADITVPKGDCLSAAHKLVQTILEEVESYRAKEDTTTQAMLDELIEYLGKLAWQIEAMS